MLFRLDLTYWLTVHGFVTIVSVLVYTITAHVLQQRRHPTAAIAWIFFILLAPYVALPAFLVFGSRKQPRPGHRSVPMPNVGEGEQPWPIQTALALQQPQPQPYADLHVHADGRAAQAALWQQIDAASQTIDLCTFIIGNDLVGHTLVARLVAKVQAGVRVRVLVDGLGRLMHAHPDYQAMRVAGIAVVVFVPPLVSPLKGRSNLRNHRKMLITDAALPHVCRLWSGGRNLAAEYFQGESGNAPWHDLSFDLGGPLVAQAAAMFERDWRFAGGAAARSEKGPLVAPDPVAAAAVPPTGLAQLIASGPDQVDDSFYALLVTAVYRARRRIALITPYFVPDSALLAALCLAARRGVQVDLLMPARSNHPVSDIARRRALRTLAHAGGRIWTVPYMQHAKLAVIDDTLALAGSANLDSRSLFLNYELMVAFHDADAIRGFSEWFESERAPARRLEPRPAGLLTDIGEGLVLWMGFQL